jgi:potassium efflux system protein
MVMGREPPSWKEILDFRLVTIAGSIVTPGSIIVAGAVVFCTLTLATILGRSARKILKVRGVSVGVQFAAAKIVRYTVNFLGLVIAFNAMGLRLDALLAASAVVAVGIGLGLQNVAQNFISGLILLVEQPVRQGDFIRVGDALGVVSDIGLRATMIVTRDQVTIIVPNGQLITGAVINHSRPTLNLRIAVKVGVAYGTDLNLVRDTLMKVAADTTDVLDVPAPDVRLEDFADSSLNFELLVWIADPRTDLRVASALRFGIDAAFGAANIEIPFPQRDLRVRALPAESSRPVTPS